MNIMTEANLEFDNYQKSLNGQSSDTPEEAFEKYQTARCKVSSSMHDAEHKKWKEFVDGNDSKGIWKAINWKGTISGNEKVRPTNHEFALHFEKLYQCPDKEEKTKIEDLSTEKYIAQLDDPISQSEMENAIKKMKKGGYDYNVDILRLTQSIMSPLFILFFNIMFYVSYPVSLARSLLVALPKKGNLSLPVNFRGIQMLPALSSLYDHIITNRLRVYNLSHRNSEGKKSHWDTNFRLYFAWDTSKFLLGQDF